MVAIVVPGAAALELQHLVLDYNGTMAVDGQLLDGVAERLHALAPALEIHVVTADTFGSVGEQLAGLPCRVEVLPAAHQAAAKHDYVARLGAAATAAVGNGSNDRRMLEAAALGMCVLQAEGAATRTVQAADVVCSSICDALDLLRRPQRLVATLRE